MSLCVGGRNAGKIHSFVGQGDGELFLYSLGLMLTVMYTERDSKPSKPHPATSPTDRERYPLFIHSFIHLL
jgi:hypothetical protein